MRRTQKLNYAIAATLIIGILCFIVKWVTETFNATKSTVRADGVLEEPFFFLIPIGWLFLIVGLVLSVVKIVSRLGIQKNT